MHIGVLTVALGAATFEEALSYLSSQGVEAVEIGTGGHPGQDHVDRRELLEDEEARDGFEAFLEEYDMAVSALATHNNPLHPDNARAEEADGALRETIELAGELGIDCVTCFSGLPGGGPNEDVPNWITAPWPPEHAEAHAYQRDVAIDYWADVADYADTHGVDIAIEMHPNMFVYEPTGLLALRAATGDRIGANLDPSHLFWQGIDISRAIRALGSENAIHHVHAKDTQVYPARADVQGVLDTTPYADEAARSWLFRSIGYGHGATFWKDFVSELRMVGYDGALSIEHEDSLTSSREGLEKAIDLLSEAVLETTADELPGT